MKRPATSSEAVVAGGLAHRHARALAGEGPDHDAGLLGSGREVAGPLTERQPDEVALGVREVPALLAQRGHDAGAFGDDAVDPLEQRGLPLERGHGGGLRDRGDPEREGAGPDGRRDRLRRHDVPDAEPGQPVGLGEGPHRDDVGAGAVEVDGVDRVVDADELAVGLVDDDHHVGGDLVEERLELGLADGGPGRVVGRADDDDLGAVGDRSGHRVEVVPGVGAERDLHRRRAGDGHRDRVGLERAPGVDDLVAGLAERLEQVVQHRDGAGPGRQVRGRDVELLGQGGVERRTAHVGVAVHRGGCGGGRLEHARERRVRVLVRGELVRRDARPGCRRLAGDVGRDAGDRRAYLRGAGLGSRHGGHPSRGRGAVLRGDGRVRKSGWERQEHGVICALTTSCARRVTRAGRPHAVRGDCHQQMSSPKPTEGTDHTRVGRSPLAVASARLPPPAPGRARDHAGHRARSASGSPSPSRW